MMAVAVVTGGHVGRDIGAAERHGLAMIGFLVMGEAVGVALAATLVTDRLEIAVDGIPIWWAVWQSVQTEDFCHPWRNNPCTLLL